MGEFVGAEPGWVGARLLEADQQPEARQVPQPDLGLLAVAVRRARWADGLLTA